MSKSATEAWRNMTKKNNRRIPFLCPNDINNWRLSSLRSPSNSHQAFRLNKFLWNQNQNWQLFNWIFIISQFSPTSMERPETQCEWQEIIDAGLMAKGGGWGRTDVGLCHQVINYNLLRSISGHVVFFSVRSIVSIVSLSLSPRTPFFFILIFRIAGNVFFNVVLWNLRMLFLYHIF